MQKRKMFLKMILASLVRRRSRMLVALLAIMVGATILSGLGLIYFDVPRQMSSQFRSYGANMIFTPDEGESGIRAEALEQGIAMLPPAELEGYTPYRYENTQIHNMPVTLAGVDFGSVLKTSPYWHISGTLPAADGEALAGAKMAESLGLQAGDTVSAINTFELTDDIDRSLLPSYEIYTDPETGEEFCDHELVLTVTGILETGGSEEEYIYVSQGDLTALTLTDRGSDIVEVSVASSQQKLSNYVEQISEQADGLQAKLVKRVTASESTVLTKLQSLVFIVTAVVLVLTMICVATTMTAVIAERRQEIGLRKALGAENGSIIGQFMSESLLLGAVGGILGAVLGYLFAQYVSMQVFGSAITFRPLLIPITIAASVLITGLACLIPIRSAIQIDPALVLKGE
mgnify:CR=1 FL=1